MRVAYPMRVDAFEKPGGDLLQVLKYIDAGKRIGAERRPRFEGTIITDLRVDLSPFDLIHLTNIDRPVDTYSSFLAAKAARKPIVLSPIHHSYSEITQYERIGRDGIVGKISGFLGFTLLEYLRSGVRSTRYSQLLLPLLRVKLEGMRRAQRAILAGVDKIFVLTEKEKSDILLDFSETSDDRFLLLRNGLEVPMPEIENAVSRDIDVCMVGRVEARKNQIVVLETLKRLGISGVFVGAENKNHKSYCQKFRSMIADSGSTYVGNVPHEEALRIMRKAWVHVSASWFEVSSLVDLEAYSSGCGVVASGFGGTREILGDKAVYVSPASGWSIEDGITTMLRRVQQREDRFELQSKVEPIAESWSQIGDRLAEIYVQLTE
jgi:glycosyltransferase involved in cell wall biosynthesis